MYFGSAMLKNVSITKAVRLITMKKTFAQIFKTFLVLLITYSSFAGVSTVAFSSLFYSSSETSTAGLISLILFCYAVASASVSISILLFAATAFPATDILRGPSVSLSGANSSDIDSRVSWVLDCTGFLLYSLMA